MHIAVVAASAPSHMYPHLAVVTELIRRGHRVSYLVGGHLAGLATPTGADVIACTSVLPGAPGAPESFAEADPVAGMRMFFDEAVHVLPQVHAALDADRPDLVLYDIGGMAGPVAADRWGVPAAQLSPSEVAWDGYHDDMAEILGPILGSPSGLAYRRAFDDWLTDSCSGLTFDDVTGAPRRCLVLIPRVMQRNSERVGDRYRFVGPCIDPRREDPVDWSPPAGDGPLALLAFGTAYTGRADVYRNVIEALDGQAGGSYWPQAAPMSVWCPTGFSCVNPFRNRRCCGTPTVSSPTRAWVRAQRDCGSACRWWRFHRPSINRPTLHAWRPSAQAATCRTICRAWTRSATPHSASQPINRSGSPWTPSGPRSTPRADRDMPPTQLRTSRPDIGERC